MSGAEAGDVGDKDGPTKLNINDGTLIMYHN